MKPMIQIKMLMFLQAIPLLLLCVLDESKSSDGAYKMSHTRRCISYCFSFILFGLANTLQIIPISQAINEDLHKTDHYNRKQVMEMGNTITSVVKLLGLIAGPVLAAGLYQYYSIEHIYVVFAAITLANTALVIIF